MPLRQCKGIQGEMLARVEKKDLLWERLHAVPACACTTHGQALCHLPIDAAEARVPLQTPLRQCKGIPREMLARPENKDLPWELSQTCTCFACTHWWSPMLLHACH